MTRVSMGALAILLGGVGLADAQPRAEESAAELQFGYQRIVEVEHDRRHGGFATLVVRRRAPVSVVVRAAGSCNNEDYHGVSGSTPVDNDGSVRLLTLAAGGRLEGRLGRQGRVVPMFEALVGLQHRQDRSTLRFGDQVIERDRSATGIYGDLGVGLTVYLSRRVGLYGGAALSAVVGGFQPELYGTRLSAGLSIAFP